MIVRLEHGAPLPESLKILRTEKPESVTFATGSHDTTAVQQEILIDDRKKAEDIRLGMEIEPLGEVEAVQLYRESTELIRCMDEMSAMRKEMAKALYRHTWDVIESFEVLGNEVEDATAARQHFYAFVDRLKEMEKRGKSKKAVLEEVSRKFFVEAKYKYNKNSLVDALAHGTEMNCESRFKGVAATLEELGYDANSEIFINESADHCRVFLKTSDGSVIFDGSRPKPYTPEDGTATMSLNDYKRGLVGLEPVNRVVHGGDVDHNEHEKPLSWLRNKLDLLFPNEESAVSSPRAAGSWKLKRLDDYDLSRFAHLVPSPVVTLMESQLLTDLNDAVERAGSNLKKRAKAIAGWRATKMAIGGSMAMALYSVCGPVEERYADNKSPDQAADMIHDDIDALRQVLIEKIDQVASAVEKVFERQPVAVPKKETPDQESLKTGKKSSPDSRSWASLAENMPLAQLKLTKEEVYFLLAEQELTYDVADYVLDHGSIVGNNLDIDLGRGIGVSPKCWSYIIDRATEEAVDGRTLNVNIKRRGQNYDYTSVGALSTALAELAYQTDGGEAGDEAWKKLKINLEFDGIGGKWRVEGGELIAHEDGVRDWRVKDDDEQWRRSIDLAGEIYVTDIAREIADKMGDDKLVLHPENNPWRAKAYEERLKLAAEEEASMGKVTGIAESSRRESTVLLLDGDSDKELENYSRLGYEMRDLRPNEQAALQAVRAKLAQVQAVEDQNLGEQFDGQMRETQEEKEK